MNEEGEQSTTIFKIINNDLRVVVTGHIHPDLTDSQLESIGTVDVLIVPVGGNGYTLDSVGALKVIKEIDPKLVIPTHFADAAINYPVPQQELPEALRGLSMEVQEAVPKLKLNKASDLSEASKLVVLERQ
jgi:L-ascorbate metabolism protein UlaG (beta-lactamase superfamily)